MTHSVRRTVLILLFVLLLTALIGRFVFAAWEPPFDGTLRYDDIAALGPAYWPMNLYLGGPSYAVTFLTTAVFLTLLGHGRTGALSVVGAVLVGLGGLLFALTITAEVLPFAFAADPTLVPESEGRVMVDRFADGLGWLIPTIVATQVAIALGVVLALVAALVTRRLPRWLAVAGLAYVVAFLALPPEVMRGPAMVIDQVVQTLMLAAIGWYGLRAGLRPSPVDAVATDVSTGVAPTGPRVSRRAS